MKLILNGGLAALTGIAAPASVLAGLGQYKKKYVVSPEEQPPRGAYPGDDLLPDEDVMLAKSMLLPRKFGPILTN